MLAESIQGRDCYGVELRYLCKVDCSDCPECHFCNPHDIPTNISNAEVVFGVRVYEEGELVR